MGSFKWFVCLVFLLFQVDESVELTCDQACHEHAVCHDDGNNNIDCSECKPGFAGNAPHILCTDINECDLGQHNCAVDAKCVNTIGSFTCNCTSGFIGNGQVCSAIVHCQANHSCSKNAVCTNTSIGHSCECKDGFIGNGTTCSDLNECTTKNNCSVVAICSNTVGSYSCLCREGFSGDGYSCASWKDYCDEFVYANNEETLHFSKVDIGQTIDSKEICLWTGQPKGKATCTLNDIEPTFVVIEEICNSEVIKPTEVKWKLVTNESLPLALTVLNNFTTVNMTLNETLSLIEILKNLSYNLKNNSIEISGISIEELVKIGSKITSTFKNLFNKTTNFSSEQDFVSHFEDLILQIKPDVNFTHIVTEHIELTIVTNGEVKDLNGTLANVHLPFGNCESKECEKATIIIYKNSTLFPSPENNDTTISAVVTVDFGNEKHRKNIEGNITVEFELPETKQEKSEASRVKFVPLKTCAYHTEGNEWKSNRCCLIRDSNKCSCNHLTSFAMLVDYYKVLEDVSLDTVSDIGCCLSIIALAISIFLHFTNRNVRTHYTSFVFVQLCVCLLISYLVFFAGVSRTSNKLACTSVTALTHYFYLVTFCWMSVYSHTMYHKITKMGSTPPKLYFIVVTCCCYLLPMLIVILSIVLTMDLKSEVPLQKYCDERDTWSYALVGYRLQHACWIRAPTLQFGFLLPIGCLLAFNVFIFIYIVWLAIGRRLKMAKHTSNKDITKEILFSVTMAAMVGITWLFAYFMLLSSHVVYQQVMSWLFAVFNTLQGFLIFAITIVRRGDIRKQLWKPINEAIVQPVSQAGTLAKSTLKRQGKNKYVINMDMGKNTRIKSGIVAYTTDSKIIEIRKPTVTEISNISSE